MDTTVHKRILSIIHIVTGVLTIVVFLMVTTFLNIIFPFIQDGIMRDEGANGAFILEMVIMFVQSIFIFVLFVVPIPSIIGGIAVLNQKKWGMILLMISGCLSLLNFPFGSAKGVYTIWVYVEDNKQSKNVEN